MRREEFCAAALSLVLCSSAAVAQPRANSPDPQQRFAAEFIAMQRDGGPDEFRHFCRNIAREPNVTAESAQAFCAGYLYRLRLRYGPSRFVMTEQRSVGETYWLEGEQSHVVWGIRFPVAPADSSKFEGVSIYQGIYPEGYPQPARLALNDRNLHAHFQGIADADLFSGVVLVARGDDIILHRSYGLADRRSSRPVVRDTAFRIASVGKMFTAMAVLSLVERGQLDLDTPFSRYMPDYPATVASQVTLRHLLTHTSGLEIDDHQPFVEAVNNASTLEDIIAAQVRYIQHMNEGRYANFRPLGSFDYSNEEYDLLGAIVQGVTRQAWDVAVRETALRPAHAENVAFLPPPNAAVGYSALTNEGWGLDLRDSTSMLRPISRPARSQYATAEALFRFMRHVESRRQASDLIRAAASAQIDFGENSGVATGYGLGFEIERHRCHTSYGHTGAEAGVSAVARVYPDHDLTIVVLSNRDGVAVDAVTYLERALLQC